MNFFEHQDDARRTTRRLVVLFSFAVFLLVLITNIVFLGSVWLIEPSYLLRQDVPDYSLEDIHQTPALISTLSEYFNWFLILKVSGTVVGVILLVILLKRSELSGGGKSIAMRLGGSKILLDTQNSHERKILNIVEEMAIASGVAVPPVYILPEQGINAFAAGFSLNDAVIGVSRGAIEKLNRDQLQGVVAHEFSHIFNGDMRININLIAVLSGILFIGHTGRFVTRSFRHSSSDDARGVLAIALVGFVLVLVGFIGTFFGSLIKAAVSRQREFLADASAVQFTRNPEGISGALKLIGGSRFGSSMNAAHADEMSHLFFSNALSNTAAMGLASLFSTHPPLDERIRRIEPGWDGLYLKMSSEDVSGPNSDGASERTASEKLAVAERVIEGVVGAAVLGGVVGSAAGVGSISSNLSLKPKDLSDSVEHIGEIDEERWNSAKLTLTALASDIKDALHKPDSARAVIYLMLLDTSVESRTKQIAYLKENESSELKKAMEGLYEAYKLLPKHERLNVIELAVPALKEMSKEDYKMFLKHMVFLVKSDNRVDLFEWLLHALLINYLKPHFEKAKPPRAKYRSLNKLRNECRFLLSHLSYFGENNSKQGYENAFDSGFNLLDLKTSTIISREQLDLEDLNSALHHFAHLYPLVKPKLLKACAACIQADGTVTIEQYDLLRAISSLLDCPMPIMELSLQHTRLNDG